MVLINNNNLLDLLRGSPLPLGWLVAKPRQAISVITWIELLVSSRGREDERVELWLESFERLALDNPIARTTVELEQRHDLTIFSHQIIQKPTAGRSADRGCGLPRPCNSCVGISHQLAPKPMVALSLAHRLMP